MLFVTRILHTDTNCYADSLDLLYLFPRLMISTTDLWRVWSSIYTGRVGSARFEFVSGWRLHVATILLCPEFVYYILCVVTELIPCGKTTTWNILDPDAPLWCICHYIIIIIIIIIIVEVVTTSKKTLHLVFLVFSSTEAIDSV